MNNRIALCAVAVMTTLALATTPTHAQPLWGAENNVSVGDMHTGGGQDNFSFDNDGGQGAVQAYSFLDDAFVVDFEGDDMHDRGFGEALMTLSPNTNVPPTLKARSVLTGNTSGHSDINDASVSAGGFAADLFEYTGNTPTTLTLTWTLTANVSKVASGNFRRAQAIATIGVFEEGSFDYYGHIPTLVSEAGAIPKEDSMGNQAFDTNTLRITEDTGGLTESVSTDLVFDVVPGERFYLLATLDTSAAGDTNFVDAFSTLGGEFTVGSENVVSVSPEPSSLILMLAAAAATAHRRRKPRSPKAA